jgi:hypothetical protein
VSNGELDGWDLVTHERPAPRARRRVLLAAACVLAIAFGAWTLFGTWQDGPIDWQHAGHSTACSPNPMTTPGDLTMVLDLGPSLPYRPLGVRLHGVHGISVVDAKVGVVAPGADGTYALSPLAAGWPTLTGSTIAPESLVPAVGAAIDGPEDHALVLRLHVDDPTAEAGFEDVGLVYRSGLIRHEKLFEFTQRLVPADQVCPAT